MLLHLDNVKFKVKPNGLEIGGIKARFTKSSTVRNLTTEQIANALTTGKTIQPGVCPFSEKSRRAGKKGTCKEDWERQTVFMTDIDNENEAAPQETPEHIAEMLAARNLKAAFMYESYHSTAAHKRFRVALVCNEEITDPDERAKIQGALIAMSKQSDVGCINADRIFFGTDKGLIDSFTDFEAVCDKAALLALADEFKLTEQESAKSSADSKSKWTKYGETIPTGERHGTLLSFAVSMLKKYGICEKAYEAYMKRVAQCEEPKPDEEIEKIWTDACSFYKCKIEGGEDYQPPDEYAAQEFEADLEPYDYTDVGEARVFVSEYGGKSRYSTATKWLVYDCKKWNESELKAQGLAQELTDRQLKEARRMLQAARDAEDAFLEAGDDDKAKEAHEDAEAAKQYRAFVLGHLSMIFSAKWQNFCVRKTPMPVPV